MRRGRLCEKRKAFSSALEDDKAEMNECILLQTL